MGQLLEESFNVKLAEGMQHCYGDDRIDFRGEVVRRLKGNGSYKRGDVVVSGPGLSTIVIEGEYSDRSNCNPDKDAIAKLGVLDTEMNQNVLSAIAVRYPPQSNFWESNEVRPKLIKGAPLQYATFTMENGGEATRFPTEGYIDGNIWSLTDLAVIATNPYQQIVKVADQTLIKIKTAVEYISRAINHTPPMKIY